ncbi:protease pro-enzyme activation domain-containing protein [Geomonas subterranea]|uniref:protease pro-enzyme activation domain-containing protein n=1 Tax=Geomonas subterranea TaxID=2847989 RepID=UPI001CD2BDD6|nr:protease pro-enzyme activation domain-containing protein [Geomonas fuzhouensis]
MKVVLKKFPLCLGLLFAVATVAGAPSSCWAGNSAQVRLAGHVPARSVASARRLGRLPAVTQMRFSFTLPLRNQQALDDLLRRIYDPADPHYGHYLTGAQFTERFAPTVADYEAVKSYARGLGLTITGTHANRTVLDVAGPAAAVEAAFDLQMHQYQAHSGHNFFAPDREPGVPDAVAARISGMVGLDSSAAWHTHSHAARATEVPMATPYQVGTGPGGGMTPKDIAAAYNLSSVGATGAGQTLALFQLDGYTPSDVAAYAGYYGIPSIPLQNVLVDGFSGAPGSGAGEVTLDIELQMALAPGASKIIVYQGPNTAKGVLDTYNRIATDNVAKQVSSSWGLSEGESGSSFLSSENAIFQQMAVQGQTVYAAAGDSGAYDNGSTLSVDDPASQPYVVGVGGTRLYLNSGGSYNRESAWNSDGTVTGGAGGGGVSAFWPIPSWQQRLGNVASSVMRNVPDVALNSDPGTGYSIYYQGKWWIYGGTSCAAPLWAAFTARVNQQRAAGGLAPLGFANPVLYQVGTGSGYGSTFHDVADSTTNLYYPAITGYDNATGWGSFNGANLLAALAPSSSSTPTSTPTVTVPASPAGLKATAGNGTVALSWSASSGATGYSVYRGTAPGKEGTTPVKTGLTTTAYTDTVANGTTYYYKVSAGNSAGSSALSNEASATPTAPLAFTSGVSGSIGTTTAQIQWSTNFASNSVIRYGTSSGSLGKSLSSSTLVTSHVVKLSSLSRKTTYYFQVSSSAGSSTVTSAIYYFKTQ